jgi:hemerythrin-like domain-containing protein
MIEKIYQQMSIYQILKTEHDKVKAILQGLLLIDSKDQFHQVHMNLEKHIEGEERVLYPNLKQFPELEMNIKDAYDEHKEIKQLLKELIALPDQDDMFKQKLKLLIEKLNHHIDDEEKEVFPAAEKLLPKEDSEQIKNNYLKIEGKG